MSKNDGFAEGVAALVRHVIQARAESPLRQQYSGDCFDVDAEDLVTLIMRREKEVNDIIERCLDEHPMEYSDRVACDARKKVPAASLPTASVLVRIDGHHDYSRVRGGQPAPCGGSGRTVFAPSRAPSAADGAICPACGKLVHGREVK